MKEQVEKLSMLNIDMNDFYAITLYESEIRLQGRYYGRTYNKLKELGFVFVLDEGSGYLESSKNGINVTLTPLG
jgi:hypothetical protein